MIDSSEFTARVQAAFQPSPRGVVGLVDELFRLSQLYQLRLNFADGQCSVCRLGYEDHTTLPITIPKSVFRAALARIAAICNQQHSNSATPYRGKGDIAIETPFTDDLSPPIPPSTCFVSFVNTPAEQQLEIRFSRRSVGDGNRFTVLLRDNRKVAVYGHSLTYIQNATNPNDSGSYGVLAQVKGDEVMVALFRVSEVIGVFRGALGQTGTIPVSGSSLGQPQHA